MSETILVTGGAGFVGSNLAIQLKKEFSANRVISLDNLKRRGSELNLSRLRAAGVEFIHGDIRNPEDLSEIGGFDFLIESSAEPSVHAGYDSSPAYLINTNLSGTINCLEACRKQKAKIIFLSTSRVYPIQAIRSLKLKDESTRFEFDETNEVLGASIRGISEKFTLEGGRSMYGATKLSSELMLTEYCEMYGLEGVINRCGVLTGPWQMGKVDQGFMVLWLAKHIYNQKLSYMGFGGAGHQVRDILHVDDLFDLVKIQMNDMKKVNQHIFNVGGGRKVSVSLVELTQLVQKQTGTNIPIDSVPETRQADIPYYISDCSRVKDSLGWEPIRGVASIVEEIYVWLSENKEALRPILS